jgi:hypothetical protein
MIDSFGRAPLQQQLHAISKNFSEYQYIACIGAELQLVFPRCIIAEVVFKYVEMVAYVLSQEMLTNAAVVMDVNADDLLVISLPNLQLSADGASNRKSTTSALRRAKHSAYSGMMCSEALGITSSAVTCAPMLLNRNHAGGPNDLQRLTAPSASPNVSAINAWLANTSPSAKHDSHLQSAHTQSGDGTHDKPKASALDLIFINMAILSDFSNLSGNQMQRVNECIEV